MRELVGALLVALLGVLLVVLWRDPGEEPSVAYQPNSTDLRFVDFPMFVMCGGSWELRHGCGIKGLREVGRTDFAPAVAKQAQQKAAAGKRPLLLSIGSRDFRGDAYDYVQVLGNTTGVDYRLALVEPDEHWHPRIPKFFARWVREFPKRNIPWEEAELVKAAVSASCPAEVIVFYKISKAAIDLVETDDPEYAQWLRDHFGASSLDIEWLKNDLRQNVLHKWQITEDEMRKYVREVPVRCLTPFQLLEKLNASLSDLVMVTVDAEGQDRQIVQLLLEAGARPAQIFFETNIGREPNKWVVPVVQNAGYKMGVHCDKECPRGASANLVAVHEDFY